MGDGACGVYIAASHHNDIFFCLMAYTIFCLAFSRDIDFKICKCFIYFDDVGDIFRWSKSIKENLVMFICIHIWSIISYPVNKGIWHYWYSHIRNIDLFSIWHLLFLFQLYRSSKGNSSHSFPSRIVSLLGIIKHSTLYSIYPSCRSICESWLHLSVIVGNTVTMKN